MFNVALTGEAETPAGDPSAQALRRSGCAPGRAVCFQLAVENLGIPSPRTGAGPVVVPATPGADGVESGCASRADCRLGDTASRRRTVNVIPPSSRRRGARQLTGVDRILRGGASTSRDEQANASRTAVVRVRQTRGSILPATPPTSPCRQWRTSTVAGGSQWAGRRRSRPTARTAAEQVHERRRGPDHGDRRQSRELLRQRPRRHRPAQSARSSAERARQRAALSLDAARIATSGAASPSSARRRGALGEAWCRRTVAVGRARPRSARSGARRRWHARSATTMSRPTRRRPRS